MTSNPIFESINLASTIHEPQLPRPPSSRSSRSSTSSISDASDEELDPTEFLSTESPQLLKQSIEPQKTSSSSLSNSIDTITESLDLLSDLSSHPTDSPLQHLQEVYQTLQRDLLHNLSLHKQALNRGSNSLNQIREVISQNLHQISENQYSLNELYQREASFNKSMVKKFVKWDTKRDKLLKKVQTIKSSSNDHGIKLLKLLDEADNLDSEIVKLESKLNSLKAKRKILLDEINDTSSVLESRSSAFVKSFKELDSVGETAIFDILRQNSLLDEKSRILVKRVPVDVTFQNQYKKFKDAESLMESHIPDNKSGNSEANPGTLAAGAGQTRNAVAAQHNPDSIGAQPYNPDSMGTQPYNPDSMGTQPYDPGAMGTQPYNPDPTTPHHPSAADSPYHDGFNKGHRQSEKLKQQLQYIFNTYVKPLLEQNERRHTPIRVDDRDNTITSKIDLVPILAFLEHKVDAYTQLSKETGQISTVYHQYGSCWNDICSSLKRNENELQASIFGDKLTIDSTISTLLSNSIEILLKSTSYASTISKDPMSPIMGLILNEATALLSALELVPSVRPESVTIYRDKFKQKGVDQHQMQPESTPSAPGPISDPISGSISASDFLYNVSSNAIEHKIIDKVESVPPLKGKTSGRNLNGKQLKGE